MLYETSPAKLTVGYIKFVQELVEACESEAGNKHLISLSSALAKRYQMSGLFMLVSVFRFMEHIRYMAFLFTMQNNSRARDVFKIRGSGGAL